MPGEQPTRIRSPRNILMAKLAILSDTHDHLRTLETVLREAQQRGASMVLHCGDLCAPFMVRALGSGFTAGPVHIILGNNEGDGRLLQTVASAFGHLTIHGIYAELVVGSRQIAMIHYPEPARRIAQSGHFDLVCYGHDHLRHCERLGGGWLLNPGDLMGLKATPSWALYDTEADNIDIIEL
jgi:putative phosphoesterase